MAEEFALIHVVVCYSPAARQVIELRVQLPPTGTAMEAVRMSGLLDQCAELKNTPLDLGVWGRKAAEAQVLREGDRVEVYRPLQVDPKLARRQRFKKQGQRGAGLFATRREGAKAGY